MICDTSDRFAQNAERTFDKRPLNFSINRITNLQMPFHRCSMNSTETVLNPEYILDAPMLAERLHKPLPWVYSRTRNRARISGKPLPHLPCGGGSRNLLFYWPDVSNWLMDSGQERKN